VTEPAKPKLLIVEDDAGLQAQLKWAYEAFEVIQATDREAALAALRAEAPAVVTLDLGLPPDPDGTSEGFAVLDAIMALKPDTKVIVASGHDPRGAEDKRLPFADAEPGMAGAETLLAMLLTLERDGRIDMARVFDLCATAPARLLGVEAGVLAQGYEADIALIDPEKPWIVDRRKMEASAGNTPFDGQPTQGRVTALFKGGVAVKL